MFKLQHNTHPDIAGSIAVMSISAEYAIKYKKIYVYFYVEITLYAR